MGHEIRVLYLRCPFPAVHFQKAVVVSVRNRAVDQLVKHGPLSCEGWSTNYGGNSDN